MAVEQHLRGRRNICVKVWKKNVSCRRNSKCNGSVTRMVVVCSRKRKEAVGVPWNLAVGDRVEGHEVEEIGRGQVL